MVVQTFLYLHISMLDLNGVKIIARMWDNMMAICPMKNIYSISSSFIEDFIVIPRLIFKFHWDLILNMINIINLIVLLCVPISRTNLEISILPSLNPTSFQNKPCNDNLVQ